MFHCGFFTSVLLVLSVWPEVASSFSACVSSVFVLSKVQHNIIVLIRCTPHSTSLHEGCCCSHLCQALSFHLQTQLSGCSNLTSCPLSLLSLPASLSLFCLQTISTQFFSNKRLEKLCTIRLFSYTTIQTFSRVVAIVTLLR